MCPQHDHCYSSAARHPTSARPKSKNNLERVPETSLGTDGSGRLLYHRGVDKQRTDALSRSVLHRSVHQKDRDRGNCLAREWSMDESSRPQRDGCGGRHPKWQALSDPRSRSALHRGISSILKSVGVDCVKLPPRSPNLNAYAERFVRSIKESCLNRLILFGEQSLRTAIQNFVAHYHSERNHQGLRNQLISPEAGHLGSKGSKGEVQRRQRLGGMLNYYYRAAA